MRFFAVFRFELAYQARRAWPWLIGIALFALVFQFMRVNYLEDALYSELFLNSPFLIAGATVFGGLLWLVTSGVVAGEAAARDVTTGMYPLVYTSAVSKAEYLGGRFAAAFAINALLLLAVQAGIIAAVYAPGVPPEMIGPFRPAAHLTAYVYVALVNAFATTAVQFALAVRTGRPMAAYFGSFLLFFTGFFIASFLLFRQGFGALLDPIGIRFVVEDLARQWTAIEKNTRLLGLESVLLSNRLFWIGIGIAVLALTQARFRFAHRADGGLLARARKWGQTPFSKRGLSPFTFSTPVLATAWASFRALAGSWIGIFMLVLLTLMTIPVVLDQMAWGGAQILPATPMVLAELTGPLATQLSRWLIVPLLIIFLTGEIVWRERDAGLGDINDAMPGSEWAPLVGKFLGLALFLALLMTLLSLAGVVAQTILGYDQYEIGLYVKVMLGLQFADYLLFAALTFFIHTAANQKYAGHLIAVLMYTFMALPQMFGVEHDMLVYGAGPSWSLTSMRGFGASLAPWEWFKAYWVAWALVLLVAARLLWVRGRETRLAPRLRIARLRLAGATMATAVVSLVLVTFIGGYVFYNTNILNAYVSRSERMERQAEYERRYARHAHLPHPALAKTSLRVELYPDDRTATIQGTYTLVNRGDAPIEAVHVSISPGVETSAISFDRPSANALTDEMHFYRIYTLERPLRPGDTLAMTFEVRSAPNGFGEDGVSEAVSGNGTRVPSAWLPSIGYQRSRELLGPGDRRDYGLPARMVIPSLDDAGAPAERGSAAALEAVIGTSEDQTAVAPGALKAAWSANGRRYFHYATDGPAGSEYTILSARYVTRDSTWTGGGRNVAIRVLHHPTHTANIERFLRATHASLDYYTRAFGPYPYGHLTLAEIPAIGTGMHADPSLVTFTEATALWRPAEDDAAFDLPFAVVAHEMAHQWTVPYAAVEGAPVLSEGVAWYYAMRAIEASRGAGQLEHLLRFMRQPHPYPAIRRGEPLIRGLDPYMSYRRGPFALYAMSEYAGIDRINAALRRLLEAHRPQDAPLATMRDLYRELQTVTPNEYQYLLHDLFEVNTYWELETQQAMAHQIDGGAWQVTLDVRARKVVYDEAGVETQMPIDDWIEIGVYLDGDAPGRPSYLEKHRIASGAESITVTLPPASERAGRAPVRAGIDPRYLLIDTERDNNVRAIAARPAG